MKLLKNRLLLFSTLLILMAAACLYFNAVSIIAADSPQPAGMVLNVQGKVYLLKDGAEKKCKPMAPLFVNDVIRTGRNSSLQVVLYKQNREMEIGRMSVVTITEDGVKKAAGKMKTTASESKIPLPKVSTITSKALMGAVADYTHRVPVLKKKFPDTNTSPPDTSSPAPPGQPPGGGRDEESDDDGEEEREKKVFLHKIVKEFRLEEPFRPEPYLKPEVKLRWFAQLYEKFEITITKLNADNPEAPENTLTTTTTKNEYIFTDGEDSKFPLKYGGKYKITVTPIDKKGKKDPPKTVEVEIEPKDKAEEMAGVYAQYKEKIKENPDNPRSYILMADYLYRNRHYEKALNVIKELQKLDRDNPYVYYFKAQVYEKQGNNYYYKQNIRKAKDKEKKLQKKEDKVLNLFSD